MPRELLKISELSEDFNADFYPRIKRSWLTAYRYARSMKAGEVFPPIIVGVYKDKKYVVDGWHRIDAVKMLKEEYIEADVRRYDNAVDLFVDSVKANAKHGRALSTQERVRIIAKLEAMNFELEQIKEIIKIPVEDIKRLKARTIIGPDGKPVYLKGMSERSARGAGVPLEDLGSIEQGSFSVRGVIQLLTQLIALLEEEIYPVENEEVKELTVQLYMLLQEKLKLAVEAQ